MEVVHVTVFRQLLDRVSADVKRHCQAKGYVEGGWLNPLVPQDSVAAWAMAGLLTSQRQFDHYVAVAPEGHVYGYFFEKRGATILSVFVDYPPRRFEALDDLSQISGRRVLILEDDVVSGISLKFVTDALEPYSPTSLALYLGREKDYQQLQNVPPQIEMVFLAEDCLDPALRGQQEAEFARFFEAGGGA